MGYCRFGSRMVTGIDEPAISGTFSLRARSYMGLALSHE